MTFNPAHKNSAHPSDDDQSAGEFKAHPTASEPQTEKTAVPDPLLGLLVDGRYRILSLIARGGMATVYHAVDQRLDRDVAIKVMHPHLIDSGSFLTRFQQEARSVARLVHPHIVTVFDQGKLHGTAYIVMELVTGPTVRDALNRRGPYPLGEALSIIRTIAQGLDAAHRSGVIHRDIKPENILFSAEGTPKIADFGLARTISEVSVASQSTVLGTVAYIPPEVVTTGHCDARGDIYSLGVMLYELLTGRTPFSGSHAMNVAYSHVHKTIPAPSQQLPWIPTEVDELVAEMTARDLDERLDSASAVVTEIQKLLHDLPDDLLNKHATPPSSLSADSSETPSSDHTVSLGPSGHTVALPPVALKTGEVPPVVPVSHHATEQIPLGSEVAAHSASQKRRWPWIVALLLVLGVLGSASGVWWYQALGPGAYAAMPTVEGLPESDALARITVLGLTAERA